MNKTLILTLMMAGAALLDAAAQTRASAIHSAIGINVKDAPYLAAGDARKVEDAVAISSTHLVTSATANFTARDVGRKVWACENSTGFVSVPLTTIVAVNSATEIEIEDAVAGSGAWLRLVIGTDDSEKILAAKNDAMAGNQPLYIPAGNYILTKQTLAFSYAQQTRAPNVIGDGSQHTVFYVCADFDYTGMSHSNVIVGGNRGHAVGATWKGMAFDGCDGKFINPAGGIDAVISPCSGWTCARFEDIRVENFRHVSYGIQNVGNNLIVNCHVEDAGDYAGIRCYGQAQVMHSYSGNNTGMGLHVSHVGDNGPFLWTGGILDENSTVPTVLVEGSMDVQFSGAVIMAGTMGKAVRVDGGSEARFTSCVICPFNGHYATALQVDAGGRATLSMCRLRAHGSGFYAIDNAGSVADALGNTFAGPLNGAPPVTLLQSRHVPAADPGEPGQIYHNAGSLMLSLPPP